MMAAGFEDIPVVTVSFTSGLNEQPGFEVK